MTLNAQLLYKTWLESRTRFLAGVAVIAGLCLAVLLLPDALGRIDPSGIRRSWSAYLYLRIYGGLARGIFLFFALMLGLGGLNAERDRHTAGFTLSLPVSRLRIAAMRAAAGLLQIAVLAAIPALLVPLLSTSAGESYGFGETGSFWVLWTVVGGGVYAASYLASCLFQSEFTALLASLLCFYFYPLVVARTAALRALPLHIHYIMNGTGMPYVDHATQRFTGPLPWTILAGVLLTALALLTVALRITQRGDFS